MLDDVHAADADAVAAFVDGLLRAAPRRLHTILICRGKPPIPLSRLRTVGDVEELTGADLRFSAEETGELLRLETGEAVDPELAERLQASVGGWPAAIRLIAFSRGTAKGAPSRELAGERHEHLLPDYLGEEVLARLPARQRELLLRASLLDRFNVPLLEALATVRGGEPVSRADLERLRALELYREIPGLSETWFAFHPLFREILGDELVRTADADAVADLHRHIAEWFATAGLTRDAVHHFVEAGDLPAAAALIESRLSEAFAREDWQSVASWLRAIPDGGNPREGRSSSWRRHGSRISAVAMPASPRSWRRCATRESATRSPMPSAQRWPYSQTGPTAIPTRRSRPRKMPSRAFPRANAIGMATPTWRSGWP